MDGCRSRTVAARERSSPSLGPVRAIDTPESAVAGARAATTRLLDTVAALDDDAVRRPSLLPGWTVGHVLTHIARNADSHTRALRAAMTGRVADRYPGGGQQRDSDIETGAGRSAAALRADVEKSADDLGRCWDDILARDDNGAVWAVVGRSVGSDEPVQQLPWKRWRELEVHHADLGLPVFTFEHWSSEYVRRELRLAEMAWRASHSMGMTPLPQLALRLPPPRRLAWLLGRLDVEGLPTVEPWW